MKRSSSSKVTSSHHHRRPVTSSQAGRSSSHSSLEVQSSPVLLATRSLSARTLTGPRQSVDSAHNSTRSASSASCTSRRKTNPHSQRRTESSRSRVELSRRERKEVEPLQLPVKKGFNIAEHLQDSVDNDRLRQSASADVHKLLQDISSVMHSVSPSLQPGFSPTSDGGGEEESVASRYNGIGEEGRGVEPKLAGRRAHLRSKVAANFSLPVEHQQGALPLPPATEDGVELERKPRRTGHSSTRPRVPHLNIGDTHDPANNGPTNGLPVNIEGDLEADGQPNGGENDDELEAERGTGGCLQKAPSRPELLGVNGVSQNAEESLGQSMEGEGLGPEQENAKSGGGELSQKAASQVMEVRSLLEEKRAGLSRSRLEELERAQSEVEARERKRVERDQRRAAKMKADRMAAIAELRKRREEKRVLQETIVQEEMSALEASGMVKRPRGGGKKASNKATLGVPRPAPAAPVGVKGVTGGSTAVTDEVLQDFFEAGGVKPRPSTAPIPEATPIAPPTTTTYDQIMDTLRLLEEVPPALEPAVAMDTTRGVGRGVSAGLSEGKLQSILSYLDQVEKAELDRSNMLAKSLSRSNGSSKQPLSSVSPSANLAQPNVGESDLEAVSAAANDVTATVLAQRMELDSKAKTVDMLQKALNQQRELTVYHAKEMEKEGQKRIELQRAEYETTIQRHQCFIDQLIDDKKVLSERCEHLVKELRELDKKYKTRLSSLETSHTAELSKLKQVSAAAEKLRREKWWAEETQRIKEATVKGLEPEIQRIIAKGKAEVQRLKAVHEAELMQADERASRRFVAQMEEVREQCAVEKEQACAHERELARQRYEKMAEQEELNYQQQRRRLFGEVAQEKEKLAEQFQRQKLTSDLKLKEAAEIHDRQIEELKVLHHQELEEVALRHRSEVRSKEDRFLAEKQTWEENLLRSQAAEMMTKERELRGKLREERDKEIEMVISKLEEDTASSREETERAAESRVRRIREKYEAELKEVEKSERGALEKFNTMKIRVLDLEGEVASLQTQLRHKDQEVERIGGVASKLTQERDEVSDIVRQEFADRLVGTEEENKELKREMSEQRARHKVELERVKKSSAQEMEEVHNRVRQALEKKEGNIATLRDQYEGALKRADHLQMLLQRQRTQILKK